jgi:hypothetical protein
VTTSLFCPAIAKPLVVPAMEFAAGEAFAEGLVPRTVHRRTGSLTAWTPSIPNSLYDAVPFRFVVYV